MSTMKLTEKVALTSFLLVLIGLGVASNYYEKLNMDRSKLPKYVEEHNLFQRWITNHKNKDINLEADDFRLVEENEVFNTERIGVFSASDPVYKTSFEKILKDQKKIKDSRFSPNNLQFVDYRYELRTGIAGAFINPNELWYLGQDGDRIIENKLLACSIRANCIFDRAYFIDNNTVVASEFSRNVDKDADFPPCLQTEKCEYTVKLYVIDLKKNSSLVYQSAPFSLVLASKIEGF